MCSDPYPTHNQSPVDPHDEIKPRLQRELRVFIAENLKPKGTVVGGLRVLDGLRVQPADKAVQGSKHAGSIVFYSVLENSLWTVLRLGDLMEAQLDSVVCWIDGCKRDKHAIDRVIGIDPTFFVVRPLFFCAVLKKRRQERTTGESTMRDGRF